MYGHGRFLCDLLHKIPNDEKAPGKSKAVQILHSVFHHDNTNTYLISFAQNLLQHLLKAAMVGSFTE